MRASLAARATGNGDARGERVLASAGPHVRGSKSSEGVSTFRIELQKSFDEAAAQKKLLLCLGNERTGGERGLSPKRETAPGETVPGVESRWQNREIDAGLRGHPQGCRGRWSSIDGRRLGSQQPSPFHEGAGKAISAHLSERHREIDDV